MFALSKEIKKSSTYKVVRTSGRNIKIMPLMVTTKRETLKTPSCETPSSWGPELERYHPHGRGNNELPETTKEIWLVTPALPYYEGYL